MSTYPVLRTTSFSTVVAGLTGILDDIAAATGGGMQVLGWRGQRAWVPPSAWIDMRPASTRTEPGRVIDTLPFELWLTVPPNTDESAEIDELALLVDVALPIVDGAIARSVARERLSVDYVNRTGFSFQNAQQSGSAGDPGSVLALVIPLAVQWPETSC